MRRVHDVVVHLVWCVRHRLALLDAWDDARRIELFVRKSADVDATLIVAGCASDHVHVVARVPTARPIAEVVRRLKGASSRVENLTHPARRFEWQDGYWCESVSPGALDPLIAYVQRQREHHAASSAEAWETLLSDAADDGR